jgi:hypothetical protein
LFVGKVWVRGFARTKVVVGEGVEADVEEDGCAGGACVDGAVEGGCVCRGPAAARDEHERAEAECRR